MAGEFAVDENAFYTASAYFYAETVARDVTISIRWFSDSLLYLSTDLGDVVTEVVDEWVRAHVTALAPAGAAFADLEFDIDGLAEDHYIDALLVEKTATLREYFDVSTIEPVADGIWEGAMHASRSFFYPKREIRDYRLRAVLPEEIPPGQDFDLYYEPAP